MLVRVRSKDGIFRFPLEPTDDAAKLVDKVLESTSNADPATLTLSNQPRGGEMDANGLRGNTLADLGISHGHLLYAAYKELASAASTSASVAPTPPPQSTPAVASRPEPTAKAKAKARIQVDEDAVDKYWDGRDGKIPRPRDAKFCRHGDKAMCDYCMPLEPHDTNYHAEHSIKHLSFHAHLRKLDTSANYLPLQEEDYTVKVPCPSGQHPPWPAGICTKCQPSAITLQRQPYRMIDHVEFAHPSLIEDLLSFWRATGTQRFGFLLGRYEPYDKVPMGIKAVVDAISEPPQEGDADGLTLGVPWQDSSRIERLARYCGMAVIGMIYTDLSPQDPTFTDPDAAGKVLCKRHQHSFFLSGCEVLFAAALQRANPSPSRHSPTGRFNSKFVTCVLTGTDEGAIDVSAYQISEQGMAMTQADMIEASVSPSTIRVRPSEGSRYVPEVFYRYKNEYKIEVKESAKPTFPVEYLLVTATNGFPNVPSPRFLSTRFPTENRPGLHDQSLERALSAIANLEGEKLVGTLSDWHLVCFLDTCGYLDDGDIQALCRVAVSHDAGVDLASLEARTGWQTLAAIAREHAPQQPQQRASSPGGATTMAEMMGGGGGGGGGSSASSTMGTGAYAGKGGDKSTAPPSQSQSRSQSQSQSQSQSRSQSQSQSQSQSRSQSQTQSRGTSASDPILYTGSDDEQQDDYEEGDEEDDDDDDMFEDAGADSPAPSHDVSGAASPLAPASAPAPAAAASATKTCPHCTFDNAAGATDCDVCGLPL